MSGVVTAMPGVRRGRAAAIAAGVVVLAVALLVALDVGGLRSRLAGGAKGAAIRSLAVLPLQNLSGDPSQEYFADGIDRGADRRPRPDRRAPHHLADLGHVVPGHEETVARDRAGARRRGGRRGVGLARERQGPRDGAARSRRRRTSTSGRRRTSATSATCSPWKVKLRRQSPEPAGSSCLRRSWRSSRRPSASTRPPSSPM